jgi:hypothetical protein
MPDDGNLTAKSIIVVTTANMPEITKGNPIQESPNSMPLPKNQLIAGAVIPINTSTTETVVFSVAMVCGSTRALSRALLSATNELPMLTVMREMMKSHGLPATPINSNPTVMIVMETRASRRSLAIGRDL